MEKQKNRDIVLTTLEYFCDGAIEDWNVPELDKGVWLGGDEAYNSVFQN